MQTVSQKADLVFVLTLGLILGWALALGAQVVPTRDEVRPRTPAPAVVRRTPTPTDEVIQLEGRAGEIKVDVQKPRVQLFSARRKPAAGKGGLERAFRETLRGASVWEKGHVPKAAMRKPKKGEKVQTKTEHIR